MISLKTILGFGLSFLTMPYVHGADVTVNRSAEITRTLDEGSHTLFLHCTEKACTVVKTQDNTPVDSVEISLKTADRILNQFFEKLPATLDNAEAPSSGAILKWEINSGAKTHKGYWLRSEFNRKVATDRKKAIDAAASLENSLSVELLSKKIK